MKITGSKQEMDLVASLCDVALKAGGVQNLAGVTQVLNSMEVQDECGVTSVESEEGLDESKAGLENSRCKDKGAGVKEFGA